MLNKEYNQKLQRMLTNVEVLNITNLSISIISKLNICEGLLKNETVHKRMTLTFMRHSFIKGFKSLTSTNLGLISSNQ